MCFPILIVNKIYDIEEATGYIDEKPKGAIKKAVQVLSKHQEIQFLGFFILFFTVFVAS